MDFLESLFELGERNQRKKNGFFQQENHHADDDDHDDYHDHDPHQQIPANFHPQVPINPVMTRAGIVCQNCSTQTIKGAKFCHGCGSAIEINSNCASCGSQLPANAPFCPQCGYKNG